MKIDNKNLWILTGYDLFALEGPNGLKIEPLARRVGISKSSFYHHFADIQIFIDLLLNYHLERAKIIAEYEKACKSIDPELINVLLDHKKDLLFNKQLRLNRADPRFSKCFEFTNQFAELAILEIWAKNIGFIPTSKVVKILFSLVVENFYLKINEETLNYQWLSEYFKDLAKLGHEFTNP